MLKIENRIPFDIQQENIDFIARSFIENPNISNDFYISAFFLDLFNCLSYNPLKQNEMISLLKIINNKINHQNEVIIKCKKILISIIFQVYQNDIDIEEKIPYIAFLYKLYENNYFDFQFIFDSFQQQLLNNHNVFRNFKFLFIIWFAPELETFNEPFLNDQIQDLNQFTKSSDCSPLFFPIAKNIDSLRENNWEILRNLRNICFLPDLYLTLKETFQTNGEITDIIEPSIFIPCQFFQHRPSISMIKSFFRSSDFDINDSGLDFTIMDDKDHLFTYFITASGSLNYVQSLIERNVNLNGTLHIASLFHKDEIFDYLCNYFNDQGIEAILTDNVWGLGTVLHQAAISDNTKVLDYYFSHNIDITAIVDCEGKIVLHYAAQYNSVHVLNSIENHFFKDKETVPNDDPSFVVFTSFVNSMDDNGLIPLMYAALNNSIQAVQYILRMSRFFKLVIDVNARDVSGRTALHYAAKVGADQVVLELLQFHDIDKDPLDNSLRLPSHFATHFGHSAALMALITNGSSINAQSKNGWTPLKFAIACGSIQCVSILLNHVSLNQNERDDLFHFAEERQRHDIAKMILK